MTQRCSTDGSGRPGSVCRHPVKTGSGSDPHFGLWRGFRDHNWPGQADWRWQRGLSWVVLSLIGVLPQKRRSACQTSTHWASAVTAYMPGNVTLAARNGYSSWVSLSNAGGNGAAQQSYGVGCAVERAADDRRE